jgi:transcriptional regulator of nitric oxide reductase
MYRRNAGITLENEGIGIGRIAALRAIFTFALMLAFMAVLGVIMTRPAYASLCVWVNPDRDIRNFFPGAGSYSTEMKRYTKEQEAVIVKRLGSPLDPDESEFKFYRVKKQDQVVGTVLTHQARGRYGAVQTVVAIDNDGRIIGVYVQRHREPVNLNQEPFLKQFKGKTAHDPFAVGQDIQSIRGSEQSCRAVAFSVKKIIIAYDVLATR